MRVEAKGQARYWTLEDGKVLVGRDLPTLIATMKRPSLSPTALFAMAAGRASIWLSPFDGVNRLTFGHELRVTPAGPRVTRWLRPDESGPVAGEPAILMREAIAGAIGDAAGGQASAAVALSSGLDSTVVLALAARNSQLRDRLLAFCATPAAGSVPEIKGRRSNEWPAAVSVADRAGVRAECLVNSGNFNWLDATDDFHRRNLMPVLTAANLWWLRTLEVEAMASGHRVILTGQSGNATFSNGLPRAPQPLRPDGTHEVASRTRDVLSRLRRDGLRHPPSALRPGLVVRMPEHVLEMDAWTRWCLAEPPAPERGPWSGADVTWKDPLGSAAVVRLAWSLPSSVWGDDRDLARRVARGLVPERVRLDPVRGIQGVDLPAMILRHADSYVAAIDRVCMSPSAAQFLDAHVLRGSAAMLRGGLRSAAAFQRHYLRPLAVGLFAAWWDEQGPVGTGSG